MAYCPICRGEMAVMDVACPHCGYDFPPERPIRREGWLHSPLADAVLLAGAVVSLLLSVIMTVAAVRELARGNVFFGCIVGPLLAVWFLATTVVFMRVTLKGPRQ